MNIIKIKYPYLSKLILKLAIESGSMANKTFDPSKGGIGTKLNTINKIFAYTISPRSETKLLAGKNLTIIPNTIATTKFAIGPAAPTNAGPHLRSLKLYGLYGTGLA